MMQILHYHKAMNTIYRDGKMKISVYADHAPPHFHVRTPDGDSAVDLATMMELAGCANRKLLAKAIAWALANRSLIEAEWNQLNGD
ncbi:MAG: DUF4160 domain-containing protein [Giesbergeria sp.]|uniref:DUF4160 domain-containing protein n=1 Tax=Giesbergeria sp. TaxID=2818473 RepID=UPI00260F9A78|nr:DUF4160 domain-containing protein [Giesbergeria sp.]MDD2611020.1 DUF4160 domain-containing protein [Giesbergeria sp.]